MSTIHDWDIKPSAAVDAARCAKTSATESSHKQFANGRTANSAFRGTDFAAIFQSKREALAKAHILR